MSSTQSQTGTTVSELPNFMLPTVASIYGTWKAELKRRRIVARQSAKEKIYPFRVHWLSVFHKKITLFLISVDTLSSFIQTLTPQLK